MVQKMCFRSPAPFKESEGGQKGKKNRPLPLKKMRLSSIMYAHCHSFQVGFSSHYRSHTAVKSHSFRGNLIISLRWPEGRQQKLCNFYIIIFGSCRAVFLTPCFTAFAERKSTEVVRKLFFFYTALWWMTLENVAGMNLSFLTTWPPPYFNTQNSSIIYLFDLNSFASSNT